MKEFALLVSAVVLFLVFAPIGFLIELVFNLFIINRYLLKVALSIDQAGNVVCASLLNFFLISDKSKYKFGHEDETISSVLGKNKISGTLTFLGKSLGFFLNKIDSNHLEKSIENGK